MEDIYSPPSYELISPQVGELADDLPDNPTQNTWKFPVLYKKNVKGGTEVWAIYFNGVKLVAIHGKNLSEKFITSEFDVVPKAKRDLTAQALLDARHKYKLKYTKGKYRESLEEENTHVGAMLCAKYSEKDIKNFPVGVQEKLNGIRLMVKKVGDSAKGMTRQNNPVNHLDKILSDCDDFMEYLPDGITFDGEVFVEGMDLTEISKIYRSGMGADGKVTAGVDPRRNDLHYYIYDVILQQDDTYLDRYNMLVGAFDDYLDDHPDTNLRILETKIAGSYEEIDEIMDEVTERGGEGVVVRKLADADEPKDMTRYREGRGKRIFKYKKFTDEEGEIVGVSEGRNREKGLAMLIVKDSRGNELTIRPAETFEVRKEWFDNPEELIGKPYTFRYQELSPYNVPLMATGVCLRDYE